MSTEQSAVVPLRRPPIRQSAVVRRDLTPFDVFVDTIGSWWPLRPYSVGGERVRDVVVERQPGGLVYEVWADGTTIPWGRLLVWDRRSGS